MNIQTTFTCGDMAWVIQRLRDGRAYPFCGIVGKIIVEITDSPGIEGEEFVDNYKPQKNHVESYMLVETGIGSGSVYILGVHIFTNKLACQEAILKQQHQRELKSA